MRFGGEFAVGAGQDAIEEFQDGDFRAEAVPDGAEFQADVSAADDDQALGHFGK